MVYPNSRSWPNAVNGNVSFEFTSHSVRTKRHVHLGDCVSNMVFEPLSSHIQRLEKGVRDKRGGETYRRVVENVWLAARIFGLEEMGNAFVGEHVGSAAVDRMHQVVSEIFLRKFFKENFTFSCQYFEYQSAKWRKRC